MYQHDAHSFPREDPVIAAKLAAEIQKAQKAEEAAQRKVAKERVATAKPTPTTKQQPLENNDKKITLMHHKIRLYFQHFGDRLVTKLPKSLPRDEAASKELLDSVEAELHSKGGIDQAANMYVNGVVAAERITQVWNPLGLKLSGPAASFSQTVVANREKWNELVTEFAISNAEWFMLGPGKRLLMLTVQTAMAVDAANKVASKMDQQAPKEKDDESQ